MDEHGIPRLREIAVFLAAAGLVMPVFHRLRVSPALGFLLVGVAVGPFGFAQILPAGHWLRVAVIQDLDGVRALSELGVLFLMFTIGVELSFDRLWAMRRWVLGLGGAQILATVAAIAGLLHVLGTPIEPALVLGGALALSSTAIVMQLLAERRQRGTTVGRAGFAVLLMQDLAVVPILVLVGSAAPNDDGTAWLALGTALLKAIVAVGAIVLIGRLLLRPVLRFAGVSRNRESFMALTLLGILATAWATGAAGLSMALGALLAGLLVGESEFRHQIEADIEPFKGLLLGLFFMGVGMSIDPRRLWSDGSTVLVAVVVLGLLKASIVALLALIAGLPTRAAVETGVLLGQGGEFSFVVLALAASIGALPAELAQMATLVVGVGMMATPPLTALASRLLDALPRRAEPYDADVAEAGDLQDHVVIAGFGRAGQRIASVLDRQEIPLAALDLDVKVVEAARAKGIRAYFGDASLPDVLRHLNCRAAQALVVTMDDPAAAERAVVGIRRDYPNLAIFARARDDAHAQRLVECGATSVVQETVEASLQLAGHVLEGAGVPDETVDQILAQHRDDASTSP